MKSMVGELMSMMKEQKINVSNKAGNISIAHFIAEIAIAKSGSMTDIEADEAIINHFNPGGLGGVPYFMYDGIRVWLTGKRDEFLRKTLLGTDAVNHPEDRRSSVGGVDQSIEKTGSSINRLHGIREQMRTDGLF